jgi:hypothetical protein
LQLGSTGTITDADGSSKLDAARRGESELHGCGMDQHPHITGRNVNASVPRSVLRKSVLQRPNNVAEICIGVILQFNVLENHYGAISTSTTVC